MMRRSCPSLKWHAPFSLRRCETMSIYGRMIIPAFCPFLNGSRVLIEAEVLSLGTALPAAKKGFLVQVELAAEALTSAWARELFWLQAHQRHADHRLR